jgi:hypothetical protein
MQAMNRTSHLGLNGGWITLLLRLCRLKRPRKFFGEATFSPLNTERNADVDGNGLLTNGDRKLA